MNENKKQWWSKKKILILFSKVYAAGVEVRWRGVKENSLLLIHHRSRAYTIVWIVENVELSLKAFENDEFEVCEFRR